MMGAAMGAASGMAGGGGMSGSGGSASATNGDFSGGDSSNQFNFAPPQYQVEANQKRDLGMQMQTFGILGLAVVALWLFTRKK